MVSKHPGADMGRRPPGQDVVGARKCPIRSRALNQRTRGVILSRLVDQAFGAREGVVDDDERSLGDDVYQDLYSASLQKRMSALLRKT